ncbi:MAG: transposase [Acidobacteriota bacterium]
MWRSSRSPRSVCGLASRRNSCVPFKDPKPALEYILENIAKIDARGFPERQIPRDRQRDRARFLQPHARGLTPARRPHHSSGRVAALLMKPERLSAGQQGHVNAFLEFCPKARRLRRLALQFRAMLRWRKAGRLPAWIHTAASSGFSFLVQFARTLQRDLVAVTQALTTPWSNGPVEGQMNRLKMIKRQM